MVINVGAQRFQRQTVRGSSTNRMKAAVSDSCDNQCVICTGDCS